VKISQLIGKRVMIIGDHPHSGEYGTVKEIKHTLAGWGLEIKLENCPHGSDGCFVFKADNLRVIDVTINSSKKQRRKATW
jgi:hypothetical protein